MTNLSSLFQANLRWCLPTILRVEGNTQFPKHFVLCLNKRRWTKSRNQVILSFKFTTLLPPDPVVSMDGYSKRRKRFLLYNYIVTFLRNFHKLFLSVSRTATNSICKRLQKNTSQVFLLHLHYQFTRIPVPEFPLVENETDYIKQYLFYAVLCNLITTNTYKSNVIHLILCKNYGRRSLLTNIIILTSMILTSVCLNSKVFAL